MMLKKKKKVDEMYFNLIYLSYHTKEPQIFNMSAIEEVLPLLIRQEGQFVLDTGILQYTRYISYLFIAKLLQTDKELEFKLDIVEGTGQKEMIMKSLRAKQMTISL